MQKIDSDSFFQEISQKKEDKKIPYMGKHNFNISRQVGRWTRTMLDPKQNHVLCRTGVKIVDRGPLGPF